ncbi:MAG TPA: amidohydrolase family protein, partial [Saprospiraceae bacterium]|nr:amidohydrolase family protein [Saprospiraceae bacterium]
FSADLVYPVSGKPILNGVVITDDAGKILAIERRDQYDSAGLEIYKGAIVPGFINTHCHLELSHMKGVAPTGTGLLPFLNTVVALRNFDEETILAAIEAADREMYEAGIVAVGDISNKADTASTKSKSKIRYYTFVEMFDFIQESLAEQTFENYYRVFEQQSDVNGNRKSCVPHAPYTVSKSLFQKINSVNPEGCTVSIHNQETVHENNFFLSKTGGFIDFYKGFNFSLDAFSPSGKTSVHYALEQMNPDCRTLFVHNTMSDEADIAAAQNWSDKTFWATCPNANLYIENRLPDYRNFQNQNVKMTIGTDSLTSNWQLSVLEEMKTILRFQSYLDFETVLTWATLNGAQALGFEDQLGSIETGKTPGLVLLENLDRTGRLQSATTARRLI